MSQKLFEELVSQQEERVFKLAEKIIPNITRDDVMQPNDFPELENHPNFRYEEGVLEGIRTAEMAFRSCEKSKNDL